MNSLGLFWAAQAVSRFGDPITLIALTIVTYRQTQSALYTALAVVIATLPTAAFGFVAVRLPTRWDRGAQWSCATWPAPY